MTISHVIYLEFARLIVSWQWVTEVPCLRFLTSLNNFFNLAVEILEKKFWYL